MTEITSPDHPDTESASVFATVPSDWKSWLAFEGQVNASRQARANFRDWMSTHLDPARDAGRLGLGLFAAGEPERARPHLLESRDDLGRLLASRALERTGDEAQARALLDELVDSPAVGVRARLDLLALLERRGEHEAMGAQVEGLRRLGASAADVAFAEGLVAEAEGDHPGAIASWRLALQHDPRHADALFRLAYRLDLDGEDREAIELYEHFIRGEVPPHVGPLMNLGVLYEDREDHRNARRIYELVLQSDPRNERARRYLADAEASLNQFYDESRERKVDKQNAVLRIPVTDFELSVRARNCLQRMNIHTLGDLVSRTESELLSFKNFGETSLQEVKDILGMKGLRLGMLPSPPTRAVAEVDRNDVKSLSIGELDLSVRSRAALQTLGIATVGDLTRTAESTLLACKNFGQTSLDEIRTKLSNLGLNLPG